VDAAVLAGVLKKHGCIEGVDEGVAIVVAQLAFIVGGIVVGIVFFAQFGISLSFSNIKYLPWYNGVEGDKIVNSQILQSKQKRLQSKW